MKARCRISGKFVAVKTFFDVKGDDAKIKMVIEEGRLLQRLKHTNIVECLDVFEPTE